MKIIMFFIFCGVCNVAFAASEKPNEVGFILKSKHFKNSDQYMENNYGIFIRHKYAFFAAYKNSYNQDTYSAGLTAKKIYKNFFFSITSSITYGYHDLAPLRSAVFPSAGLKYRDFFVNLHFLYDVAALSVSREF